MILEKYERTLPGAANRIIKMAEKQADHRHAIENRVIRSNTRNEAFGIAVTFTLSMTALSGSIYLIASNKQVAGFLTMISTLLTLAYNFHSKSKAEKEAIQKLKESETSDK